MFADKSSEGFEDLMNTFREASKGFKGKLMFVFVDNSVEDNDQILDFFSLGKDIAFRIVDVSLCSLVGYYIRLSYFGKATNINVGCYLNH